MSQDINYAGDIVFEKAELLSGMSANGSLTGIDIRPQIIKMEVFESIFYPFTTAKIYVKDAIGLLNVAPIRGEEIINIVAYTPSIGKRLNFAFHVYKLTDRYQDRDRVSVYTLHCISAEAFVNVNKKISRGFSGNISNIAEDILKNTSYGLACRKALSIESTANAIRYVSNYWTPLENIQYLAEHAVSADDKHSYVFFENRDGYNFLSLERLYKNPSIQTFSKDNMTSGTKQDVETNYSRIQEYEIIEMFDYYKNSDDGVFGSSQSNYDILFKLHTMYDYIPSEDTSPVMLNGKLPYSNTLIMGSNNYVFDSVSHSDLFNDAPGGLFRDQIRMSKLGLASYNGIKIVVSGRSDYTVGYVVEVQIPRDASIKKSDTDSPWDPVLSGRYIISEINHGIDGSGHSCVMTLIKDSVQ